jgi:hypothetical protein
MMISSQKYDTTHNSRSNKDLISIVYTYMIKFIQTMEASTHQSQNCCMSKYGQNVDKNRRHDNKIGSMRRQQQCTTKTIPLIQFLILKSIIECKRFVSFMKYVWWKRSFPSSSKIEFAFRESNDNKNVTSGVCRIRTHPKINIVHSYNICKL